jgi:hypothetical protein
MDWFNNITVKNKMAILLLVIMVAAVSFIVVSYVLLKLWQTSMDYNNIFFYKYNKKCEQMLKEYGNWKIQKVYLVRQPFGNLVSLCFNVITLFQYNKYIAESQDNYPYHPAIIFEIRQKNKIKLLLLEKNNSINICDSFLINKTHELKNVPIKKAFTIKKILETTRQRMGTKDFFNWNLNKHNCQEFIKEILITVCQYTNKHQEFIFRDKIMKLYKPSDFSLHLVNCLFICINFVEKYVLDQLFY